MIKTIFLLPFAAIGLVTGVSGCGEEVEALNRAARGENPFAVYEDAADADTTPQVEAQVETEGADAPAVETDGDTVTVTSPDGASRSVVTQSGAGDGTLSVRQEGGATVVKRSSSAGQVTIVQGSSADLDQSETAEDIRARADEMRSRMMSRMLD